MTRQRLDALYARVPAIDCKGLCAFSCTPVEMAAGELHRIRRSGVDLPVISSAERRAAEGACAALVDGRCSVYELRPMICRLWGAMRRVRCPHGCEPVDGRALLDDQESVELLALSFEVAGSPPGAVPITDAVGFVRAAFALPGVAELTADLFDRGHAGDRDRACLP